jgi:hypothetical protein
MQVPDDLLYTVRSDILGLIDGLAEESPVDGDTTLEATAPTIARTSSYLLQMGDTTLQHNFIVMSKKSGVPLVTADGPSTELGYEWVPAEGTYWRLSPEEVKIRVTNTYASAEFADPWWATFSFWYLKIMKQFLRLIDAEYERRHAVNAFAQETKSFWHGAAGAPTPLNPPANKDNEPAHQHDDPTDDRDPKKQRMMDEPEENEYEVPVFPDQQPRSATTTCPATLTGQLAGGITTAALSAALTKAEQAQRAAAREKGEHP